MGLPHYAPILEVVRDLSRVELVDTAWTVSTKGPCAACWFLSFGILLTQVFPFGSDIQDKFRIMAYQSLVDRK